MLLAILGYGRAQAEYTVDFNTAIATSSSDFKVASNWQHIVDVDTYYDNNMSYSYREDMGIDGSGTLLAMKQEMSDWGSTGTPTYDMLVTPVVSGTVTIYAFPYSASSSNRAFVEFYSLNSSATARVAKLGSKEWTSTAGASWTAVTITVSEPQRIGIRAQYVYLDNFYAQNAEIVAETSLSVSAVMNSDGQTGYNGTNPTFYQQADGNMLAELKVTLINDGDVDFVAGSTPNYTLTPAYASASNGAKTYVEEAAVPITVDIPAGQSKTIDVAFSVPFLTGYKFWFVRENVSGTTSTSFRYATSVAYEPKFAFRAVGTTAGLTSAEAWGVISASTTKNYEIYNSGTAPLTVKSITLPDGFTSDNAPTEQFVVPAGESQAIDITQDAAVAGQYAGNLVIVYLDKNGNETTYTLALSTTVIAAGTWWADFNSSREASVTFPAGSVAEAGIRQGTVYVSAANYDGYLYSYTSNSYASENNKFITPLLHADAGDALTFEARRDESASATYNVKVYISTDRKDWGSPVLTVSAADLTTAFQSFTVNFPTEGNYYVAFAVYGVRIDNLVGLQQVEVEHDMYIKSVNWPDASIKSGTAQTKPIVDVIPLTTEAASDYTVQFIYGDNVVEGTPVALTASNTSSSSKSFSFTYTPVVEQTTAFTGAKVVFTFQDGTTIETETYDFTVTNEPKFHFLNSIPTSKWYEPTDRSEPIVFGRTNKEETQSFYFYNWGTAPLTISDIRLPEGFSASVKTPLIVAPFDENNLSAAAQPVDIIFNPEAPGDYSGQLEVVYIDATGEEATFALPVSGTKLDPAKWYANFDDNKFPLGTTYQDNMSVTYVSEDNYAIVSSATSKNLFITPLLTAEAGETMRFDAKLYNSSWSEGQVVVYAAATRDDLIDTEAGKRQELFSVNSERGLTATMQTFEFTIPSAGDYYIGFEISNRAYVDEVYGLELAETGLDLALASFNIPTQGMQNIPMTATFNVRNFGLEDVAGEDYLILVGIGDVKSTAEEGPVTLKMTPKLSDDGTSVSVSIQSPKAGTFPVTIAFTDTEGNSLIEVEQDVTFTEETASGELVIGNKKSTSNYVPFYSTWADDSSGKAMADWIYTPEQLEAFGLSSGATITQIKFIGTPGGPRTFNNLSVDVWIAQENVNDFVAMSPDKEAMTHVQVYNEETVVFTQNVEHEFIIDLSENPIVYDGVSGIHIFTNINGHGQYLGIAFDIDTDYPYSYYAHGSGSYSSVGGKPVAYLSLAVNPVAIAGTVTNESGEPVADATVTLKSADGEGVQYEGTTDADGKFNFNVIQSTRNYDATVTAEGYDETTVENLDFSAAVDGVLTQNFTLMATPAFVEVTILEGRTGTTLSSKYALDLSEVEGLTAYKAIGKVTTNAAYIITDEVNTVAPAEEGLLLKGAAGKYQIPVAKDDEADEAAFADNLLEPALEGYTPTDEDIAAKTVYRYVMVGDECGFQLVTNTSQTLAAGKAYLRLTDELADAAAMYGITFEEGGVVNGIDTAVSGQLDVNAPMYNLAGQRVERSYRGVVIQNGRKYVKH